MTGAPWRRRAWRRCALGVASAAATGAACLDFSTNPDEFAAIELRPFPSPAVVAGDTLRDSLGQVAPLEAVVFDGSGDPVEAPVEFIARDTLVTVTATGLAVAKDSVDGVSEILASTVGLQSAVRRLDVVPRPDSLEASGTIDTLRWVIPDAPATNVSTALRVRLLNRTASGVQAVRSWVVRFRLEFRGVPVPPDDTSLVYLVGETGQPSSVDTTDVQGFASRRVRLRSGPGLSALDSAVVFVEAQHRGAPVAGAPVRLVVPMVPQAAPAAGGRAADSRAEWGAPSATAASLRRLPE